MTKKNVFRYTLSNGFTILICPQRLAPKVSLQLWYNVGSKHEATGEKGMAHFIEHMIFKGTKKLLSESDINLVTQKLSGYANAFTSYDYTGYLFDIPVANWEKVLPIFADCMRNCSFDQDHMNSEVKAVIQELKMYRDDYSSSLQEALTTAIFEAHPYHHPIIGYKQDLWSLHQDTLIAFYKKYYVPNNAVLVVVGDVYPDEAFEKIKLWFEKIPSGNNRLMPSFFINNEIQSKAITLFRVVEQSIFILAYMIPGAKARKDFVYDVIGYILANGKSSRLQKLLVDEKELATSVSAMTYDLFDAQLFFIECKPKEEKDIPLIKEIILNQIAIIIQHGLSEFELRRALKIAQVEHQQMLESTQKKAYVIGRSFISIGDQEYPFIYGNYELEELHREIIEIIKHYFRPTVCHQGSVVNIPQSDISYLDAVQQQSDELDTNILFGKERISTVELGKYVHQVTVNKLEKKTFAQPRVLSLKNGLTVMMYFTDHVDTVEAILNYKANYLWDPKEYLGIGYIVCKAMLEGTKKYPGSTFMDLVESYGISLTCTPGQIDVTMLKNDVAKGLTFISEIIQDALFDQKDIERIKKIAQAKLKDYWDTPKSFATQMAVQKIYGQHPYAHLVLGQEDTLKKLTRDICFSYYKKILTPQDAVLSIVGNFDVSAIECVIREQFDTWTGDQVVDIAYPNIAPVHSEIITVKKNRDQVVLAFVGLSVARLDPMYDQLVVFDQILSGGMSSRLFELREQTGLFYTIGGSLVQGAGKQPGMVSFQTIVSNDRLLEAQQVILHCFDTAIDTVTDEEFDQAKEVVVNAYPSLYESNEAIASTFLFLKKYNLSFDYFEKSIDRIRSMKKETMIASVKSILNSKKLIVVRVGRF
ncbi:insulinase family protein [Candidatus Dependentiae bacterium]|nr:insulinase family protein [Candidatus Dependentiae bacterium]